MKKLFAVLLALLLLTGCAVSPPQNTTGATGIAATTEATVPDSLVDLEHPLSAANAAMQVFSLGRGNCSGVMAFQQDLLLLFEEGGTELVRFDTQGGYISHSTKLNCSIAPESGRLYVGDQGIGYFDEVARTVVVLDNQLRETDRVKLPEALVGIPILAKDLTNVFYCTESQLRVLDIKTGISRMLRQQEDPMLGTQALCFGETAISYRATDDGQEYLAFVDVNTGLLLGSGKDISAMATGEKSYFLIHRDGPVEEKLVGDLEGNLHRWHPAQKDGRVYPLLQQEKALTASSTEGWNLDLYDLKTGSRTANAAVKQISGIHGAAAMDEKGVWLAVEDDHTQQDALVYWDLTQAQLADDALYFAKRYTAQDPDTEGLGQCQIQADAIAQKYGVDIRIGTQALEVPSDYDMVAEHQVEVYQQMLPRLDALLEGLPEGFLAKLNRLSDSRKLHICLVRSVSDRVPSVQYWHDGDAYMAISMTDAFAHSFYTELYMVLDTFIFTENSMLDLWSKLNPKGFSYTLTYDETAAAGYEKLLSGDARAFIDYASMSYPREDRAAIFAWAMEQNAAECFQPEIMQKKLVRLCEAIRDAYRWEKDERAFPWEQYLEKPMAYTGKKK